MGFPEKARMLNQFLENVENWFICLQGKVFQPPAFEKKLSHFFFKHENVIVGGQVEMYGFGEIYKTINIASDKYRLTEIPEEVIFSILDEVFSDGENHVIPKMFILDPDSKIPKLQMKARWMPPPDYVKELREKRNFVTLQEFEALEPLLKQVYAHEGVKPPNYIDQQPFSQVPVSYNEN